MFTGSHSLRLWRHTCPSLCLVPSRGQSKHPYRSLNLYDTLVDHACNAIHFPASKKCIQSYRTSVHKQIKGIQTANIRTTARLRPRFDAPERCHPPRVSYDGAEKFTPCASGASSEKLIVHALHRTYCFQASPPDSRPLRNANNVSSYRTHNPDGHER